MSPQRRGVLSDGPLGLMARDTFPAATVETRDRADYSLGVDDVERRRLLGQCALHRVEAESLLDRVGLRPGDRALDLGCGPMGVLDLLSGRVGPTGRVVGVDREARYLTVAGQELELRGIGGVELLAGDATCTGLPDGSFDLVHERLVLNNVPQPQAVVAEMVRLTKPGGHVVVQDVDWLTWTCLPEHPSWNRLRRAAATAWSGDVHLGRRLPALLHAAGLVDVRVVPHLRVFRAGELYHRLLLRFVALHRSRILADTSWTPAQLDDSVAELDEHLAQPATVTLYATLFQSWGRRP